MMTLDGTLWVEDELPYMVFCHEWVQIKDGTVESVRLKDDLSANHWDKMERPGVVIEGRHVTHFTFAVLDVPKDQDRGNDAHGSKIIVVPFDGAALDRDLQNHSP
jgi:hypothetical protein